MATINQNIESVDLIFEDIGKAINEMYVKMFQLGPVVLELDEEECCITPPSEYANLIRQIPQNLVLDPSMFTARIEKIE